MNMVVPRVVATALVDVRLVADTMGRYSENPVH